MTHRTTLALALFGCCGFAVAADMPPAAPNPVTPEAAEFFEKRVRPVLAEHCLGCHGAKESKVGLRLDTRAGLLKGSDFGPVIVPGDPAKSLLIQAVRYEGDIKMPPKPKAKLPDEAIEALTAWVKMGAPWPETGPVAADPNADAWKKHWAFQPVKLPALPAVKDTAWPASPIDFFILAKLEAKGMTPAPPADRRTLIRRASFDLIGLPPTPAEVDAFVSDPAPDAYERLIDRLLADPRYGERWGRYWLDVARYANERGYVGVNVDRTYPFAYTYRDWVIRAFNDDLPYDQFLIQQLAADQLPLGADTRPLAAMGFLTVGRRFLNNPHDIIDDRIDVVTRGMLGLTVTCARCHDHKYDPIPTRDYYSLYGVFASSREPDELPLLEPFTRGPGYEEFQKELARLEEEKARFERENEQMRKERPREFREKIKPFDNKIKRLHATHPAAPPRGMVLVDLPQPVTPRVFVRGNARNPGPEVPRQFLGVLAGEKREPFQHGSGRLELARAIASPDNPLTARVLVNRVWLHHFGAGLVRTPSDFGLRSEPPSHPELLDWLAARFVADGWSIKKLHRLIMLSSTYRQASDGNPAYARTDPDNLLLGRMNRRRLDFEALRDSLLFVAGQLDPTMGGQAVDLVKPPLSRRRTVYGFIDRQNLPGMYRTFDFASPDTHSPQRYVTTVPQQALFLMNSPFVLEQARALVARPDVQARTDPAERIGHLYRLLFGRPATPDEVAAARGFLASAADQAGLTPWEKYAQVLLLTNEFAFVD